MSEKAPQNTGNKNYKIGNSQSASLLAHITINCFAVDQKKLMLLLIDQAKNLLDLVIYSASTYMPVLSRTGILSVHIRRLHGLSPHLQGSAHVHQPDKDASLPGFQIYAVH